MADKQDDLDAVRTLVLTLEPFDTGVQERIIRWAREKLKLRTDQDEQSQHEGQNEQDKGEQRQTRGKHSQDIKTFITAKNPGSDVQFAATVAYFYRFEAEPSSRKDAITADDLRDACRKVGGRQRLTNPGQTLRNAHNLGLLDRTDTPGVFSVNTVGENLVAMTLPSSTAEGTSAKKKKLVKKTKQKRLRKKAKGR